MIGKLAVVLTASMLRKVAIAVLCTSLSILGAPISDAESIVASRATTFLNSLGINTHVAQGYDPATYVAPLQYIGVKNVRDGDNDGNAAPFITLHQQTGVLIDVQAYCDLGTEISTAEALAAAGALLAIEGPNEPNNFPIIYNGQPGGGTGTWLPVAQCQRDLHQMVKSNPSLAEYPVFSVSEDGAETDNVGLQFLTIPAGSGTGMPDGTVFGDFANVHNYVDPNSNQYVDNQAWKAANPTANLGWDALYVEYGVTWANHYLGYSQAQLARLPRVTTETGWDTSYAPAGPGGALWTQGVVLTNTFLAQFKRGWTYTFIYELVDGEGGGGNLGLFDSSYNPKLAATFIHNMTTILKDNAPLANPGSLSYSIPSEPATVHHLLLQKSSGTFELVVWGESASRAPSNITVNLGGKPRTVNVYDITAGTSPAVVYNNVYSIPLTLTDHAMVVEVLAR